MSEWNQEYQDEVSRLDYFFQRLYIAWAGIGEIDFTKRRPDSLDRVLKKAHELNEALSDFILDVEEVNGD